MDSDHKLSEKDRKYLRDNAFMVAINHAVVADRITTALTQAYRLCHAMSESQPYQDLAKKIFDLMDDVPDEAWKLAFAVGIDQETVESFDPGVYDQKRAALNGETWEPGSEEPYKYEHPASVLIQVIEADHSETSGEKP